MPTAQQISTYKDVQDVAKAIMAALCLHIEPQDTEATIVQKAHLLLSERGCLHTWYYDCPALVLAGTRSCLSVSGRYYAPSAERLGASNLISIDLSPLARGCWGDFSRTVALERGAVTDMPQHPEYANGLRFVQHLHREMMHFLRPDMSLGDLFEWANVRIREKGFVNLDYRSNLGHSMGNTLDDREFIRAGNATRFADIDFFSFEPFVRLKGGKWGFKHEDVFYFDAQGILQRL